MIRTSTTLNISPQDSQKTSYLVNGTHLGLLSQSAQTIHVQTNHRPLQLIVAIRAQDTASGPAMTWQRQQINAWQSFYQLLARRGSADLNSMISQYHLRPDWLICLDEQRLQAWLPAENGFYLLRQDSLRRLRPVMRHDTTQPDTGLLDEREYYALSVTLADQFYVLPPDMMAYFGTGEAATILTGLRQLPARMGDLFNTARGRGFNSDTTWLAIQVTHHEPDETPGIRLRSGDRNGQSGFTLLRPGSFAQDKLAEPPDSLSLADNEGHPEPLPEQPLFIQLMASKRFWMLIGVVVALIVILVLALLIGKAIGRQTPTVTTRTTTQATTLATTTLITPTPTVRPTTTATTTEALPQLVVKARTLNLRQEASKDSTLITTLASGDILTQLEEPENDWVMVRTDEGMVGYVFYSYVEPYSP